MSAKMQNRVDNELQKVHSELNELADPFEYVINNEPRFTFHIRENMRPFAHLTEESKKPFVYVVGKKVYENASAMLDGELEEFERPAKVGWQFMINKRTQNNLSHLRNAHKKPKDGACATSVAPPSKSSSSASHSKTKSVVPEAPADVSSVVKAAAALVSAVSSLVASVESVVQSRRLQHDSARTLSKTRDVACFKERSSAGSERDAPRESRRAPHESDNDDVDDKGKNRNKQDRDDTARKSKRVSFSKGRMSESDSDDDREIFHGRVRGYVNGSISVDNDDDDDDDDKDEDYDDVDANGNLVDPSFLVSDGEEGTISEQDSGDDYGGNDSDEDEVNARGRRSHGRSGKDGYDSDERRTRESRERSKNTRPASLYGDCHQKAKSRTETARPLHAYAKDGANGHANRNSASDIRASAHGHRQQKTPVASRKRSPTEHDAMPPSKRPKAYDHAEDAPDASAATKSRTGRAASPNVGLSDMDPASLMDMIM